MRRSNGFALKVVALGLMVATQPCLGMMGFSGLSTGDFRAEMAKYHRDNLAIQNEFIGRAESTFDGLSADCATMLTDIFGDVRLHPQFKTAIDLLSPSYAVHYRALKQARRQATLNPWEMEALSLLILRGMDGSQLKPAFGPRQTLNPGPAFWANIRKALSSGREPGSTGAAALDILNYRPELLTQAPASERYGVPFQ